MACGNTDSAPNTWLFLLTNRFSLTTGIMSTELRKHPPYPLLSIKRQQLAMAVFGVPVVL